MEIKIERKTKQFLQLSQTTWICADDIESILYYSSKGILRRDVVDNFWVDLVSVWHEQLLRYHYRFRPNRILQKLFSIQGKDWKGQKKEKEEVEQNQHFLPFDIYNNVLMFFCPNAHCQSCLRTILLWISFPGLLLSIVRSNDLVDD